MEEQTPYLNDDEITTATLENVFKAAFMKVTVDEDGDLRIETDMGTKVFLTVDDERKPVPVAPLRPFSPDERRRYEAAKTRRQLRQELEQRYREMRAPAA